MKTNSADRIYNGRSWYAVLDEDNNPVPCDLITWATWFRETGTRRTLQWEEIKGFSVMTVFSGCRYWYKTIIMNYDGEVIWRRAADTKARAITDYIQARSLVESGGAETLKKLAHNEGDPD